MHEPWRIDSFGQWSYPFVVSWYLVLLGALVWRYRIILRFMTWRVFIATAVMLMLVLGMFFEWVAGIFYVWTFPPGRDLFEIRIPIFGWVSGHRIPICEFGWIAIVVPLFYYLYLWATLVFYDIIYVVDEDGNTYKKEERWVGFHGTTRILTRPKGKKGREFETVLQERPPGFVARCSMKYLDARKPR